MEFSHVLLVDHDNVPASEIDPGELIRSWLVDIAELHETSPIGVKVRLYGGWYMENSTSPARYRAAASVHRWPSILRVEGRFYRLTTEFADSLALPSEFGRVPVTHTVAMRTRAPRLIATPVAKSCVQSGCEIASLRKWSKGDRGCTTSACSLSFGDAFGQYEQKQVDVHLAIDLILFAVDRPETVCVGVASNDIDLAPALAYAGARSRESCTISLVRTHVSAAYLDPLLRSGGVRVVQAPVSMGET